MSRGYRALLGGGRRARRSRSRFAHDRVCSDAEGDSSRRKPKRSRFSAAQQSTISPQSAPEPTVPSPKKKQLPPDLQHWVEARRRFGLSHAHIQMARELGMNPKKLGKLANPQERWKAPLPVFIEACYFKSFRRERPENVMSIEDRFRAQRARHEAKKAAKVEGMLTRGRRR
jgi:hypothetical protein